jgi:hypothetical protein
MPLEVRFGWPALFLEVADGSSLPSFCTRYSRPVNSDRGSTPGCQLRVN